ncbi:MAG: FHA domain-containing protein, partial [Ghiorsea sp.]
MASLIIKQIVGVETVPLNGSVTLGRHPRSSIFLQDARASKHHAVIRDVGGYYIYEDLESSNGSYINGLKITKHTLSNGDVITISDTTITFSDDVMLDDDVTCMVKFEQVENQATQYQERIELTQIERFLPEREVSDLSMLRVDYEKLRMGNELLQNIGMERNLVKLLNSISSQLLRMFMADRCAILLINAKGEFEAKAV